LKIKSQQDFWAGLLFLALGIVFAVGASDHDMGSARDPGPGYFPLALSGLMVLLGAVILFFSLTFETDGGNPIGRIAWRPLLVIVGTVVLFSVALPSLGLFITCPLVILAASLAVDKLDWALLWWTSLLATWAAYLFFVVALNAPIPLGPQGM
jgi:hypothetical protein